VTGAGDLAPQTGGKSAVTGQRGQQLRGAAGTGFAMALTCSAQFVLQLEPSRVAMPAPSLAECQLRNC
jgi:hypothetical protein